MATGTWTALEQAVRANGDLAGATDYVELCALAARRAAAGDQAGAVSALVRAASADPDAAMAWVLLGDLFADAREPERAALYYSQAAAAEPAEPAHPLRLALLHHRFKQPYSAQAALRAALALDPDQADAAGLLAGLAELYPLVGVTAVVLHERPDAPVRAVCEALLEQSHPLTQLLLVDLLRDRDLSAELAGLPVTLVSARPGESRWQWANELLAVLDTPWLALVDSQVVVRPTWLEHLVLTATERCPDELAHPDLVAVIGHADLGPSATSLDRWRALHLVRHYGSGWARQVPWLYTSNVLVAREALLRVGGWDAARADAETEFSTRLTRAGTRFAYQQRARAVRTNACATLGEALAEAFGWQPPYLWEARLLVYDGANLAQLPGALIDLVAHHQLDRQIDAKFARTELTWWSLLALPLRLLDAFARTARQATPAVRPLVVHTQAAVWLGFAVRLARRAQSPALLAAVVAALAEGAPDDDEVRCFCTAEVVAAALAAADGQGFDPIAALTARDAELADAVLDALDNELAGYTPADWATVTDAAATAGDGARLIVVRPGPAKALTFDDPTPPPSPVAQAVLAAQPAQFVDILAERLKPYDGVLRLRGGDPETVVLTAADATELGWALDWALRVRESLPAGTRTVLVAPEELLATVDLAVTAPQVESVVPLSAWIAEGGAGR